MNTMLINSMPRIASIVIGYFFGCFLTGELVVRLKTGKSASEFGSGNPGMANIMREFGFKTGILVLAGDLLKTIAACLLCLFLFGGNRLSDSHLAIGQIAALLAGLGAVIGHNWPFWRGFSGGKGVAVTCMAIFIFSPLWGLFSDIAGMMVVLLTGYLPLGAVVIPTLFTVFCYFFCSKEAAFLALLLMIIMFSRHWRGLFRIIQGKEKRHAQYLKPGRKSGIPAPEDTPASEGTPGFEDNSVSTDTPAFEDNSVSTDTPAFDTAADPGSEQAQDSSSVS